MPSCSHTGLLYQGAHWLECCDCGEWLSLGPSNDDDERVQHEIALAANLAEVPDLWEPRDQAAAFEMIVRGFVFLDDLLNTLMAAVRRRAHTITSHDQDKP